MARKIKVLIVDDSAVVRQTLKQILESDCEIEVMGLASDPFVAARRLQAAIPDVITLDLEMPRMDGITFLGKIMKQHPIPVVICSSMAESGSDNALRALELGAIDIIQKPKMGTQKFLEESKIHIIDTVKAAARARIRKKPIDHRPGRISQELKEKSAPKLSADAVLAPAKVPHNIDTTEKIVVIGASTGGTEALRTFLETLPHDAPGIVIVQHMPEQFTRSFAQRLDKVCRITVKEAENRDSVLRGQALIAPGNRHILLKRSGARYFVELKDGPLVCRHRPSVDVLFRSAARFCSKNAIGVILTGMGDDGARGMLEMKQAGAFNVAQDQDSCIVYGMPKEAIKLGAVDKILSLHNIAGVVLNESGKDQISQ